MKFFSNRGLMLPDGKATAPLPLSGTTPYIDQIISTKRKPLNWHHCNLFLHANLTEKVIAYFVYTDKFSQHLLLLLINFQNTLPHFKSLPVKHIIHKEYVASKETESPQRNSIQPPLLE